MSEQNISSYLDTLSDELSLALGRAIWAFSMIEGLTYRYMKSLSSEPLDTLMGDQLFRARIKLIKHLVERIIGFSEEKEYALGYIQKAEKLAETRNVIAHNPWQIWIDFERDDFRTEIQKYTKQEKIFDLTAVRKFTEDAREVASGLEAALNVLVSKISGPSRQNGRLG